jgi:hypothetical protein
MPFGGCESIPNTDASTNALLTSSPFLDKSSGSGREGEPSYSLDNFLETKTVVIKLS